MTPDKKILVIAGPNGAGKTTFATEFLPNEADCPIFVNADLIAARAESFSFQPGCRPGSQSWMLRQIDEHARQERSFAFETTLSGRSYARRIRRWRADGYRVKLFFLRLPTPEAAIARVAQTRVGGRPRRARAGDSAAISCGFAQLRACLLRSGRCLGRVRQFGRSAPKLLAEGSRE